MRNLLKVVTLSVSAAVFALPSQAETLADALIAAYRNSNLMAQNQAVLRAADEDAAIAMSTLRPVVSYAIRAGSSFSDVNGNTRLLTGTVVPSSSFSKTFNAAFDLSVSLVIYDYGRRQLALEAARENVMATRQQLVSVEQDVLLAAVRAYVEVKLSEEIVALRQSNARLISQELGAAQDRFEVGEITRTDVSIAEAALALSRANLASAEGDLRVAREAYKAATGAYPGRLAALPNSPRIGNSLDEAIGVARRSHPSVRQSQHTVKIADLNVAMAEAAMKPTLGLGASLSASRSEADGLLRDSDTLGGSVSLNLNQTIYAGGELSARYRKALAQKEGARSGLKQAVVLVEQNLGTLWAMNGVYIASIDASRQQIAAAQAAFDGVREEAALGARTTLDVLDAEQDLLDARASRLQSEASRYYAVYQILAAMGLLTVEHLNLGIPTYDPNAYYDAVKNAPATSVQGKKLDRILKRGGGGN
ncbi:TolC family outer membrane protein [Pseudogemmobacter faecipullorum]|uniref:TolC family outer membrane protein n=1 Tax=Pseudogemmobacter faecipullorum TaxID=2755041 RepID=A0ABS8CIM6_9RHOB|nr:TolC family outer membrane protein [Pseudogemmobacter faecipullorum]MCB5409267.1 TolC family outer membrane protein [Pseudogemmobacter faecipullorum]